MPLEYPVEVVDDGSGTEYQTHYATCMCREGGSDMFSVFQIFGLQHFHIQCGNCDQSYCLAGLCTTPLVVQPSAAEPPTH